MKPTQERNQECLPPKKRDLPVSNSGGSVSTVAGGVVVCGGGGGGGLGICTDEVSSCQSSGASGDTHGPSAEWQRPQPAAVHYGVESADGIPAVSLDQYSMLYKVAVPSVTYSPTSLHPVLSHISQAYTVHSPLLQHPGLPYPPLGYAQIPHSSLQFVSSPYAAVPYAVPPGFVPGSLISPPGSMPQSHVSHLVPYQSVIQEGVVSPPPQAPMAAHAFAKAAAGGVPLMLSPDPAAQQHLGAVGVLPAAEVSPRGMPIFYHPQAARALSAPREKDMEVNGSDREQGARDAHSPYGPRSARLLQTTASSSLAQEAPRDRSLKCRRLEDRGSPGQRSTPDTDLEVQQVVGRLASSASGGSGGRKEVSFAPLNLSQGSHRDREAHGEATGRAGYAYDPRVSALLQQHQQHMGQQSHTVMLANGQPVLIPLEYHPHQLQQHYPGHANETAASHTTSSPVAELKSSDATARASLADRASVELAVAQQQQQQQQQAAPPAPGSPSHFMKGAIIQLATGELKRVEDLQTQDFVRSAEVSGGLKIDSSMVVDIRGSQHRPGLVSLHFTVGEQQSKVAIDVPPEHPFFVFGQGWSSCSPERTGQLYGLACHHLQAGDVCVSIALQQQQQPQQKQQQQHPQQQFPRTSTQTNSTSGPMGPPAPQQPRPQAHFRVERVHREREKEGLDKDEAVQHTETPSRPNRTSAEHTRSQSSYYLHTEGSVCPGAGMGAGAGASLRRWSAPGHQRYTAKGDDGPRPQMAASGHTRPSFIPQEVKLSIEGRSNAGK